MKKILCHISLLMLLCAVSFTPVWAQDKKPDGKQTAVPAADDKEKAEVSKNVDLFYQLVSYGEAQKNPLVMISAIKLFDDLPYSSIAKPGKDEKTSPPYDRTTLVNEAKQFAAGDTELLALLTKIQDAPETTEVRGGHQRPRGHTNYYAHGGGNRGAYHGGGGYYDGGHAQTCFIATAAYGSPLAERVDTLRRFRDLWLIKSSFGSAFVEFYYQHSPVLAKSISQSTTARAITRTLLYPVTVVAGAFLGQIADIVQIILAFGIVLALIALARQRRKQISVRC